MKVRSICLLSCLSFLLPCKAAPAKESTKVHNVYFSPYAYTLSARSRKSLDSMLKAHLVNNSQFMMVYGYANFFGDKDETDFISTERAKSVSGYLWSHGIQDNNILLSTGLGLVDSEVQALNRPGAENYMRVEILVQDIHKANRKTLPSAACQAATARNVADKTPERYLPQNARGYADLNPTTLSVKLANGDVFSGVLDENDKRLGYGVYIWENGDKYAGYFSKNLRQGHGTYSWSGGETFEGEWMNDEPVVGRMTDNPNKKYLLGVVADKDCHFYINEHQKPDLKHGIKTDNYLSTGTYKLKLENVENVRDTFETYYVVKSSGKHDLLTVTMGGGDKPGSMEFEQLGKTKAEPDATSVRLKQQIKQKQGEAAKNLTPKADGAKPATALKKNENPTGQKEINTLSAAMPAAPELPVKANEPAPLKTTDATPTPTNKEPESVAAVAAMSDPVKQPEAPQPKEAPANVSEKPVESATASAVPEIAHLEAAKPVEVTEPAIAAAKVVKMDMATVPTAAALPTAAENTTPASAVTETSKTAITSRDQASPIKVTAITQVSEASAKAPEITPAMATTNVEPATPVVPADSVAKVEMPPTPSATIVKQTAAASADTVKAETKAGKEAVVASTQADTVKAETKVEKEAAVATATVVSTIVPAPVAATAADTNAAVKTAEKPTTVPEAVTLSQEPAKETVVAPIESAKTVEPTKPEAEKPVVAAVLQASPVAAEATKPVASTTPVPSEQTKTEQPAVTVVKNEVPEPKAVIAEKSAPAALTNSEPVVMEKPRVLRPGSIIISEHKPGASGVTHIDHNPVIYRVREYNAHEDAEIDGRVRHKPDNSRTFSMQEHRAGHNVTTTSTTNPAPAATPEKPVAVAKKKHGLRLFKGRKGKKK